MATVLWSLISVKLNGSHVRIHWEELLRLKVAFWLTGENHKNIAMANKVVHFDILRCHMDGIAFCCNISNYRGKHISFEPGGFGIICHLRIHVSLINIFIFLLVNKPCLMFLFFFLISRNFHTPHITWFFSF